MRSRKIWHERFTREGLVLCAVYLVGLVGAALWGMSLKTPEQSISRMGCDIAQLKTARGATLSELES